MVNVPLLLAYILQLNSSFPPAFPPVRFSPSPSLLIASLVSPSESTSEQFFLLNRWIYKIFYYICHQIRVHANLGKRHGISSPYAVKYGKGLYFLVYPYSFLTTSPVSGSFTLSCIHFGHSILSFGKRPDTLFISILPSL